MLRIALIIWLACVTGCVSAPSTATQQVPLLVIAPIDVSVSWPASALDRAITTVGGILDSLEGGDRLVVRAITATSHSGDGILLDVTMPIVGKVGQFDQAGRVKALGQAKVADSIRRAARQQLSKIRTLRHPRRTDIVGALYAAAEIAASEGRRTIIVPFTDGRDDGGNGSAELDLAGLDVRFMAFEGTQLSETTRLKGLWTKRLEAAGVRSVEFIPAGQPLVLSSFRTSRASTLASTK